VKILNEKEKLVQLEVIQFIGVRLANIIFFQLKKLNTPLNLTKTGGY